MINPACPVRRGSKISEKKLILKKNKKDGIHHKSKIINSHSNIK